MSESPLRIAINGYGRIGRNVLRAWVERGCPSQLEFAAINDLGEPEALAHLTRYDSTHGRFTGKADLDHTDLVTKAAEGATSYRIP